MRDVAPVAERSGQGLWLSEAEMPARYGHIPSLDGLRAISIGIVLLAHFVDSKLFPGGLGVLIFFVISGFLISRLLLAELKAIGTISLSKFYGRRFLRLYPVIVAYTLVVLAFAVGRGSSVNLIEPLSALLYFANYLYSSYALSPATIGGSMPFAIFWSLSVEEHFYVLFPPLLLLLGDRPRHLVTALLALSAACLILRVAVAVLHPDYVGTYTFYYRTEFRLDSLAAGVLLAALCELETGRRLLVRLTHPAVFVTAGLVVLACLLIRNPFFRDTLRYTLLNGAIATLVAGVLFSGRLRGAALLLNAPPVVWIGKISYSIYVWHLMVGSIFLIDRWAPAWALFPAAIAGTLVVASASYYLIERPFLGLRHRLHARAAGAAPAAGS